MAPYRYDTPEASPLVGSIVDIIQRQGALQGMQATQTAEINARAQAASGANWGRAVETLGQLPTQMAEQQRRDQLANVDTAYKLQQMSASQATQQDAQRTRARKYAAGLALNAAIADSKDPDTGEIDAQKVYNTVGADFPDEANDWFKNYSAVEAAHSARAKAQKSDLDAEDVYVGRLANASQSAADFVDHLGTAQAAGHISKKTLARVTNDMATTDAWDPLKAQYIQTAATILGPEKRSPGEVDLNPITKAVEAVVPPKPEALSADKEDLDRYAQSIGKKDRTELTFADHQAYKAMDDARKAKLAAQEHAANRTYDNANPAPPPPPVVLNENQKKVAKDLATGSLTFSEFSKLYPSRGAQGAAMKETIYAAARDLNPTFSPANFEAGYKMATNPQNTNRLVAINSLMPVVDMITTLAASAGPGTDMPTLNKAIQDAKFEIGGKKVASLQQLQTLLGEEVGNALGVGSASDLKTQLGLKLVNPNLGPSDFLDTMQQLRSVLGARKDNLLQGMGPYGRGDAAVPIAQPPGGATSPAATPSAAAPRVKTFNPATGKAE